MISKRLLFFATLCIVNVAVSTIDDSEYNADGLSIYANAVNDERDNTDLNLNGNFEDSSMESAGLIQDSANLPYDERIRICSSKICNRVCRVLKMKGKCVKKRCKCAGFITADTVNDEYENVGLNFKEDMEGSPIGDVGPKLDSPELASEDRIRIGICHSNLCYNECRIQKLEGKCVKKRCICLPKANSVLEEGGFVDEEDKNSNLITNV